MKNNIKGIRSQAGQALMEYILVLVVVVGLVLGALYQLNSAFQVWANSYFGEYLMCLIETGEIPSLGQPNPDSECRELYQSFSLAQGQPLVGEGVGENGEAAGGGGVATSGNATAAPSGNADGSFVARNRAAGNRSGTASRFRSRGGAGGEDDEGDGISREGGSGGGTVTDGFSNEEGRAQRFAARRGNQRGARGTRTEEREEGAKRTKAKNVEQGPEQRNGPQLIKVSRAPDQTGEAPEIDDIGFGGFLRYLIIAAILIAVVLFLGGQILQVSKSME